MKTKIGYFSKEQAATNRAKGFSPCGSVYETDSGPVVVSEVSDEESLWPDAVNLGPVGKWLRPATLEEYQEGQA